MAGQVTLRVHCTKAKSHENSGAWAWPIRQPMTQIAVKINHFRTTLLPLLLRGFLPRMRTEPHASDRTIASVQPAGSHARLFLRPHPHRSFGAYSGRGFCRPPLRQVKATSDVLSPLSHTRQRSLTSAAISRARLRPCASSSKTTVSAPTTSWL